MSLVANRDDVALMANLAAFPSMCTAQPKAPVILRARIQRPKDLNPWVLSNGNRHGVVPLPHNSAHSTCSPEG